METQTIDPATIMLSNSRSGAASTSVAASIPSTAEESPEMPTSSDSDCFDIEAADSSTISVHDYSPTPQCLAAMAAKDNVNVSPRKVGLSDKELKWERRVLAELSAAADQEYFKYSLEDEKIVHDSDLSKDLVSVSSSGIHQ